MHGLPNCIDLERFSTRTSGEGVHAELDLEPTTPIVGTVSRLGEHRQGIHQSLV
jgi:hypothetical protein